MPRSGTDGAEKLRSLSKDLRRQADGKDRAKVLRRELREVAKPFVPKLRSAIRALPSHGESARRGRMSLRAQLARSVTLQIRTSGRRAGVSVFMNPRKMPTGMKALPMYMEATPGYTRWRHPDFGHDPWMTQRPHPYFTRATGSVDQMVGRAANRVVEATATDLEKNR